MSGLTVSSQKRVRYSEKREGERGTMERGREGDYGERERRREGEKEREDEMGG